MTQTSRKVKKNQCGIIVPYDDYNKTPVWALYYISFGIFRPIKSIVVVSVSRAL
jgi:hypothetical protein